MGRLRSAKMVPAVTENWYLHPLHFHTGRVANAVTLRHPHFGQYASPSLSAHRRRLNLARASSSDMRATALRLSDLASRERRKCCDTEPQERCCYTSYLVIFRILSIGT